MRFRFVFSTTDHGTVGTMFTDHSINIPQGDNQILHFAIDSSHLMAGVYRVDIIAFQTNEFGREQLVDGVYPGMFLEVTDSEESRKDVIWLPRYWSNIRLHDVEWSLEDRIQA